MVILPAMILIMTMTTGTTTSEMETTEMPPLSTTEEPDSITVQMVTWVDNAPYYISDKVPLENRGIISYILHFNKLDLCMTTRIVDNARDRYRSHQDLLNLITNRNKTDIQKRLNVTDSSRTVVVVSATTFSNRSINRMFTKIPFMKSGLLAVLVRRQDTLLLGKIIDGAFDSFEIIFVCLLLAVNVGAVVSFIEHKLANNPDFTEKGFNGIWNGIWFCIVTISTVGYGDKVPKHFLSRIISVVWMLIGLLLTATLTSSVMNAVNKEASKSGQKMGCIMNSFEKNSVNNQFPAAIPELFTSYVDMIDALRNKEINSALIDMNVAAYYLNKPSMSDIKIEEEVRGKLNVYLLVYVTDEIKRIMSSSDNCWYNEEDSNWDGSLHFEDYIDTVKALFIPSHDITLHQVRPFTEMFNNDDGGMVLYMSITSCVIICVAIISSLLTKWRIIAKRRRDNNNKITSDTGGIKVSPCKQNLSMLSTEEKIELILRNVLKEQGCTCGIKADKEKA